MANSTCRICHESESRYPLNDNGWCSVCQGMVEERNNYVDDGYSMHQANVMSGLCDPSCGGEDE